MRLVVVKRTKLGAHDLRSGIPLGDVVIQTAQLNLVAIPLNPKISYRRDYSIGGLAQAIRNIARNSNPQSESFDLLFPKVYA